MQLMHAVLADSDRDKGARFRPMVAVVVPVYRHSVLVAEALWSAIDQNTDFDVAIVAVNDGCPSPDTHAVLSEFATAFSVQVKYVRQSNKGLSAARNAGIDFAIRAWPSIEAIYFLDADNRILPFALSRAFNVLKQDTSISWVYPNIDMFGIEANFDHGGPHSRLCHLHQNISEAGSMVHRRIFDAGIRFDETMKLGYEDWDFWLQAIEKGYKGQCLADFGFQYRRRPESMLASAKRYDEGLKEYLRRKHKSLYSAGAALQFEHTESPRYLIFTQTGGECILTSDPAECSARLDDDALSELIWKARHCPSWSAFPMFAVFASSLSLETLEKNRLLHWVFWLLESKAWTFNFVAVKLHTSESQHEIRFSSTAGFKHVPALEQADLFLVRSDILLSAIREPDTTWLDSLKSPAPKPSIGWLHLDVLNLVEELPSGNLDRLYSFIYSQRLPIKRDRHPESWVWRTRVLPLPSRYFEITRNVAGGSPVFPYLKGAGKHIGFILPLVSYGGVEKIALNLAGVFKAYGWNVHLLITEHRELTILPHLLETFSSLSFLDDDNVGQGASGTRVPGMALSKWAEHGNHEQAIGLTSFLDVIVNFHSVDMAGLMGELRHRGVITVAHLQLHDYTVWNRPTGHPYLTIPYEYAYDIITACSRSLFDWCNSLGVPKEKLVFLPNAPGFRLTDEERNDALNRRKSRDPNDPLRILFLGRLDRQKGLDRIANLWGLLQQKLLHAEWRLIGGEVIEPQTSSAQYEVLRTQIEPPIVDEHFLKEVFAWADVLLLLSRFEGVPLTILEAMQCGVVPVATGVGGIPEIIRHGETGYLVDTSDEQELQQIAAEFLLKLEKDKSELARIAECAISNSTHWTWENSSRRFIQHIEKLLPIRGHFV